jgi:predicted transcriptional regulator
MNAIATQQWKDEQVRQQLNECRVSINDLTTQTGLRRGTVMASLKRLVEGGQVHRAWDGNARFGRYLYFAAGQ